MLHGIIFFHITLHVPSQSTTILRTSRHVSVSRLSLHNDVYGRVLSTHVRRGTFSRSRISLHNDSSVQLFTVLHLRLLHITLSIILYNTTCTALFRLAYLVQHLQFNILCIRVPAKHRLRIIVGGRGCVQHCLEVRVAVCCNVC